MAKDFPQYAPGGAEEKVMTTEKVHRILDEHNFPKDNRIDAEKVCSMNFDKFVGNLMHNIRKEYPNDYETRWPFKSITEHESLWIVLRKVFM
jgi:hypothetical protein